MGGRAVAQFPAPGSGAAGGLGSPQIAIKNAGGEPLFEVEVLVHNTSALLAGGEVVCAWRAHAPLPPESEKRVSLQDFESIGDR